MVRVRTLTVLLAVIALTGVSCGSDSETEVEALEQRIAELEASTTSSPNATANPTSTTTSSTSTTTTTTVPTTTTTQIEYDIAALDFATVREWVEEGDIDGRFLIFASSSCENAVDSLARVSRVFAGEIRNATALTLAASDGTATVAEAARAFEVVKEALPYGAGAAGILAGFSRIGGATEFAELVEDTISASIMGVLTFPVFVLDIEAETVDEDAIGLFGGMVLDPIEELDSLGSRSWSAYCP